MGFVLLGVTAASVAARCPAKFSLSVMGSGCLQQWMLYSIYGASKQDLDEFPTVEPR